MGVPGLQRRIVERATELGFVSVGFVPAGPLRDAPRLDAWLEQGFHGEMGWMEQHRALRVDPRGLLTGARTVIALAAAYPHRRGEAGADSIARYAVGDDYHEVLREQLRSLAAFVSAEAGSEVAARPAVDSAPLLERAVAVEAGLGWLGKSAMVLHPMTGSYTLLAELVVDIDIEPDRGEHPDRCGRCTRCIDLCPTGAIVAPYQVDARRCISYLTIELRGPIPRSLRAAVGLHLFGCDICQDVCPWNRKVDTDVMEPLQVRPEVVGASARTVLAMDPATFAATFRHSAIKRTKRRGLARNAAVVLGNLGDPDAIDPLATALHEHDEPLVRGHAAWALSRYGARRARAALEQACTREQDTYVAEEIRFALLQAPVA
jgi:epoxyqueuosine reductase